MTNYGTPSYQPQPQPYYAPAPSYNVNQAGYQGNNNGSWNGQGQQSQQTSYMRPRYNGQQRTPSYRTPAPNNNPQQGSFTPGITTTPATVPVNEVHPSTHYVENSGSSALPPRGNKPVMNMQAIEETPVSNYDIDDSAALDAIFNN